MIALLFSVAIAGQGPTTTQVDNAAAEQCRSAFARKLDLNIGSVSVTSSNHANGWTVIRGSFSGYRPPSPPAPGMAAPLHVISVRYTYRCWLRSGLVRRSRAHKISG